MLSPLDEAYLKDCKIVVVVGLTASGKTMVASKLHEGLLAGHSLYHTDDYIDYGYKESLYAMIKDIGYDANPKKLIEGVQGYRYLRKTLESGQEVDAVVVVSCDSDERQRRYYDRGKGALSAGFDKNLTTVLSDYLAGIAGKEKKPRIIQIMT